MPHPGAGAVAILSVLALVVAGCRPAAPSASAPGAAPPAKTAGQSRVTVAVSDPLEQQNPYFHSNTLLYSFFCEVLGCLLTYDSAKSQPAPQLAESWKVENPTTWVFTLRKGVKFQDGSPFTAADVVSSLQRIIDDPTSRQKYRLANIDHFEAVDDSTFRVVTKQPDSELLDEAFVLGIAITSKAQLARGDDLTKVLATGTGPYQLKEWVPKQRVVVTKTPNWWGGAVDGPDEVVYQYIPEQSARVTALLNNEIQIAQDLLPQDVERINASPNAKVEIGDAQTIMFLGMNSAFKPWDNKLLRQAVGFALDRDSLIKNVLLGYAERLDGPIGPGQYAYDPNLQPRYTYDPEKAKQLLAQAGFPNGLDVELTTTTGTYIKDREMAQAIAQMLTTAGIRTKVLTPEVATRSADLEAGKLAFFYQGRGSVRDPGPPLSQYFQTGVTKRLNYSNPDLDALFNQERATFEPEQRKQLLGRVMSLITDEAPAQFLWRHKLLWGVSNTIQWTPLPNEAIWAADIRVK
jgi:peptide/nickel transport system substrate-binding protein